MRRKVIYGGQNLLIWVLNTISLGASQIITMNNDTLLESTLNDLLSYSKDHPKTLLMPVGLHYETKVIIDGGWNINWKTAKYRNMSYQIENSNGKNFHNVNVALKMSFNTSKSL